MKSRKNLMSQPNSEGYFGKYGGSFIPEEIKKEMRKIYHSYMELKEEKSFQNELQNLLKNYVGRPSPIFYASNLSSEGGRIYLKREDLNHTGAHKINHCLGEALLAKRVGKERLIAETGAGQHGVALATAAAITGLKATIFMGAQDMEKERPNVTRMEILGAEVVPVTRGKGTLKEAVDAALESWMENTQTQFYAIGSVVGPHPFPSIVRDFQKIIGEEAAIQFKDLKGRTPDHVVACVGGGSNAIGLFQGFLENPEVQLHGVEPSGRSFKPGDHAATLTKGKPGIIHGFKCYLLQKENGEPMPVHSIASGLDYPGVGPEHCWLKDIKRVKYATINDQEAVEAFYEVSRKEGIIPAIESAHALAYAIKLSKSSNKETDILVNLSGRGDKDIEYITQNYSEGY